MSNVKRERERLLECINAMEAVAKAYNVAATVIITSPDESHVKIIPAKWTNLVVIEPPEGVSVNHMSGVGFDIDLIKAEGVDGPTYDVLARHGSIMVNLFEGLDHLLGEMEKLCGKKKQIASAVKLNKSEPVH